MPERDICLLVDEDVWNGLAAALREEGCDAVSVVARRPRGRWRRVARARGRLRRT